MMDKMEVWSGERCGLEVSAKELVVAREGKKGMVVQRFANSPAGHRELIQTLTRGGKPVRVVMEATGLYGLDVAITLSEAEGIEVMVANPRAVRSFAKAMMQRSKSDRLDALVLWNFAGRMPFRRWTRPSGRALHLWALARRLEALAHLNVAEKNRQHAASVSAAIPAMVRRSIARSLRFQEKEMAQLRREAMKCIQGDGELHRQYQLLRSMPGIGESSAIQLLAELVLLPPDRDVRQWVAYAGLDPREYSSGTSVRKHTRISKVGNGHLRRALFMPAMVACRFEPHLRGFYQHLLERGKPKRQALSAVARKMLHAIYGMFRANQRYDGSRVYALPLTAALAKFA
jgi:transposase